MSEIELGLRRLAQSGPSARVISDYALERARSNSRSPGRRWLASLAVRTASVPVALAIAWLVLYLAPAVAVQVQSAAPPNVNAWLADRAGLASRDLTVVGASATSSGRTIEVVGVYADATHTVVLTRSADGLLDPASVSLSDQFGRQYQLTDSVANSRTGDQALTFAPFSSPEQVLGTRFNLLATRLTTGSSVTVGHWSVQAVVIVKPAHSVATPARGSLDGHWVDFRSVVRSGSSLLVVIHIDAALPTPPPSAGSKFEPPVEAVLAAAGASYDPASFATETDASGSTVRILWVGIGSGGYRITLTAFGSSFSQELAI